MRARLGGRAAVEQRRKDRARALQRQQQIVLDRMALEHGRLLELAADAHHGDLGLVMARQVDVAVEKHLALVGPRLAGDDVHHRRLAGAVRADDGAHLALVDDEGQIVDGAEAVEGDRDAVEIEDACGCGSWRLTPPAAVRAPVGRRPVARLRRDAHDRHRRFGCRSAAAPCMSRSLRELRQLVPQRRRCPWAGTA